MSRTFVMCFDLLAVRRFVPVVLVDVEPRVYRADVAVGCDGGERARARAFGRRGRRVGCA